MLVKGPTEEKVRGIGSTVAGAVSGMSAQGAAGSYSVEIVLGMAKQ